MQFTIPGFGFLYGAGALTGMHGGFKWFFERNRKDRTHFTRCVKKYCSAITGIIEVIPMVVQDLTWDANISAFTMWIVVGFLTALVDLKLHPALKGILTAFLVLLPSAILIGWKEPVSLIPITIMTLILSALLGFFIHKFAGR